MLLSKISKKILYQPNAPDNPLNFRSLQQKLALFITILVSHTRQYAKPYFEEALLGYSQNFFK